MSNGGTDYNDENSNVGRGRGSYAGHGGGYNDGFVKEESGGGDGVEQDMPPPHGRG
jgi:hypothetical protein